MTKEEVDQLLNDQPLFGLPGEHWYGNYYFCGVTGFTVLFNPSQARIHYAADVHRSTVHATHVPDILTAVAVMTDLIDKHQGKEPA